MLLFLFWLILLIILAGGAAKTWLFWFHERYMTHIPLVKTIFHCPERAPVLIIRRARALRNFVSGAAYDAIAIRKLTKLLVCLLSKRRKPSRMGMEQSTFFKKNEGKGGVRGKGGKECSKTLKNRVIRRRRRRKILGFWAKFWLARNPPLVLQQSKTRGVSG